MIIDEVQDRAMLRLIDLFATLPDVDDPSTLADMALDRLPPVVRAFRQQMLWAAASYLGKPIDPTLKVKVQSPADALRVVNNCMPLDGNGGLEWPPEFSWGDYEQYLQFGTAVHLLERIGLIRDQRFRDQDDQGEADPI